ncbi:SDR family NAD(P)-dependent oxidoreductase [Rhodococcus sp. B50]|uniref:SDR family NAD(P)-dependent oxidoreductase n=1 Tax=Rhodococcus sp. B50 TaxID=2682847 RepID=UPI001FD04D41|nr:SDR family NAD(P)-dependent oxidoreductase [Rhodococcus sp. B50]
MGDASSPSVRTLSGRRVQEAGLGRLRRSHCGQPQRRVLLHALRVAGDVRRRGRVVFVNSASGGRRPSPGMSAYSAAKAGFVGVTKSTALEVAHRSITVNCVMPGFVATNIGVFVIPSGYRHCRHGFESRTVAASVFSPE